MRLAPEKFRDEQSKDVEYLHGNWLSQIAC